MAGERLSDSEAIRLAASLPPEAPHILGVAESDGDPNTEVVAVIDIDDFEDDLRDRVWQAFKRNALAHRRQLRKEGRIVDH